MQPCQRFPDPFLVLGAIIIITRTSTSAISTAAVATDTVGGETQTTTTTTSALLYAIHSTIYSGRLSVSLTSTITELP
jgi:hypothetical protein